MSEEFECEIFVDDRQKEVDFSYVKRRLNRFYPVTEVRLECGDVAFNNVGIEIKNAKDFVKSFYERDLSRQTANVINNYTIGLLVVIGDWKHELLTNHRNAMNGYKSILGTIATLSLFQVPPLFVKDNREFVTILKTMCDYTSGSKGSDGGRPVLYKKKNRTKEQVCSDMLTALDGVRRKTADKYLEHFGSIYKIVQASKEDLMEVEGVGKKTANNIFETLR